MYAPSAAINQTFIRVMPPFTLSLAADEAKLFFYSTSFSKFLHDSEGCFMVLGVIGDLRPWNSLLHYWQCYLNFYLSALSPPYAIPRQSKDPNKLYLDSSVKNTESQLSLPRWIYSVECKRFAIFLFDKCGFFRGVYALKSGESKKLKQFEDGILPASSNCLPITTADILVGYSPGLLNLADNKWQYCLFRLFHHFFLKKLQQHKRNSLIKKYSLTIRN